VIVVSIVFDARCEDCAETLSLVGRTPREAAKQARAIGWFIRGKSALCPKHKQIQSAFRRQAHS
jgi:hypothetical protein